MSVMFLWLILIYKEIATHVDQSAEQTQRKQNPSNTNQSGLNYNTMQRKQKLGQRVTKLRSVCPSWITKYNFSHLANVHTQIIQEQGVCGSEQLSLSNPYTKCQHLCNTDTLGLLNFNVQVKLKNSFKLHAAVLKNRKPLFIVILTYFSYTWPFALFYVGFNLVT